MTIVVVTALGRWMFIKDHDESTTVVFLISSATSVDGGDGGEALHMFAVNNVFIGKVRYIYFLNSQFVTPRRCRNLAIFISITRTRLITQSSHLIISCKNVGRFCFGLE